MRIEIRDRGIEPTDAIRHHAERRLHFALGRFDDRIRAVRMWILDENGPMRGGIDKACRLELRTHTNREVRVETRHEDLYVAISHAAERAGRATARLLAREARLG